MKTYTTTWKHIITNEIINISIEASNLTSAALKTVTKVEENNNIDLLNCIKTLK